MLFFVFCLFLYTQVSVWKPVNEFENGAMQTTYGRDEGRRIQQRNLKKANEKMKKAGECEEMK